MVVRPNAVLGIVSVLLGLACLVGVSGCSLFDRGVDLGVDGVEADRLTLPRLDGRDVLVVHPASMSASNDSSKSTRAKSTRAGDAGRAVRPLVVMLHGLGGDAESFARQSTWPVVSRDRSLIVAFGEGVDHSWAAGGCCGSAERDGVDDVAYIDRLIDEVSKRYEVDDKRVFVAGFSNGAMMAYRYACERGDRLAGAGSVMGTNTSGCTLGVPVSFLQISGAEDPIVPVNGGPSKSDLGDLPSAVGSIRSIARSDDCPAPQKLAKPPALSSRWSPCSAGTSVGFDVLGGVEHVYPDTGDYSATGSLITFWGL